MTEESTWVPMNSENDEEELKTGCTGLFGPAARRAFGFMGSEAMEKVFELQARRLLLAHSLHGCPRQLCPYVLSIIACRSEVEIPPSGGVNPV